MYRETLSKKKKNTHEYIHIYVEPNESMLPLNFSYRNAVEVMAFGSWVPFSCRVPFQVAMILPLSL